MHLTLRCWQPEDREQLAALCNAVDRRYLSERIPFPYTLQDADWWLGMIAEQEQSGDGLFRAILLDGEIVGNISVERRGDIRRMDAVIGYYLKTECHGRGIMTAAAKEICRLAFTQMGLARITGEVFAENKASCRVLEHCGFETEGLVRRAYLKNGELHDAVLLGLLREDWEKQGV